MYITIYWYSFRFILFSSKTKKREIIKGLEKIWGDYNTECLIVSFNHTTEEKMILCARIEGRYKI